MKKNGASQFRELNHNLDRFANKISVTLRDQNLFISYKSEL